MNQSIRSPLIRFVCSLAVLFVLVNSSQAQSPDKVIKQAVKAMTNGKGEKALREIKSWQATGKITNLKDNTTGKYQASVSQPNLFTQSFDLSGLEFSSGFNGKSAWARDSRDGLRTLTGQVSLDFQTEARFRNGRWLDFKKDKSKLVLAGQTTINGKAANMIALVTAKNVTIKMYFDATSGLLIREEIPAGDAVRVFDYSDFKTVGNLMEPHTIKLAVGDASFEIKLDSIKHNPQIDRLAFEFPKLSSEPLPDIPALLNEVGKNEEEIDRLLEKYTYTETVTSREFDNTGKLREKETETQELTFYRGHRISRQISKNGKPLSPSEEADETKHIEKQIRNIEKKEADKARKAQKEAQSNSGAGNEDDERVTISDVLRASKLVNPRRERFRNRDVIVFDFEPLPGYKPQKNYEKLFGKMAGAIWVDAADKQVARVEARLVDSYKIGGGLLASLKEGGSFVMEQDRVNNEIWLPIRADINLGVKVLLVKGLNFNQVVTYGDYKRFNVDAEKEKLRDPTAPVKP